MEKSNLIDILKYWSYWNGGLPPIIERQVELPHRLENNLVLCIQGARKSGKSTFLSQIIRHYKLDPICCALVNFEDPLFLIHSDFHILEQIVNVFTEMHPKKKLYFFFDEIQNITGWERWIRTKLERPGNAHFIITGSNASMLSGELGTTLSGRHLRIELYPFSFSEAQGVKNFSLQDYLHHGGFPASLLSPDGDRLLKQYFYDILERDVRERIGARFVQSLRQLVHIVYESAGSELSLRKISGATGIAVETVSSYLDACESAYLLFSCPFFAYSEKKRASRNKKYYPIDPGLRRTVVSKTGKDLGKSLEIAVYLELKKKYQEVYYWKDRGEIDFVVQSLGSLIPIQVAWDGPLERHHNAIESFYEHFPQAEEHIFISKSNFTDLYS